MKLLQLLRENLKKWARISGLDFILLDEKDEPVAATGEFRLPSTDRLKEFRQGEAQCVGTGNLSMWKVMEDAVLRYILLVHGAHPSAAVIGELAVCQIISLMDACAPKNDRSTFLRELLADQIPTAFISSRAKKLHMNPEADRAVFLIWTRQGDDENVLLTVRSFLSSTRDLVTVVDENCIAILKELERGNGEELTDYLAHVLVDALGAEAMTAAKVSYSRPFRRLEDAPNACREARTAMEIGRIFYTRIHVFGYQRLGLGRLIYQLPLPVCELFVREVFGESRPLELDEEILSTVRTLFENNLNLSETARKLYVHRNTLVYRFEKLQKKLGLDVRTFEDALTFHVAMMVVDYMNAKKQPEG